MTDLWHPFADMGAVDASGELVFERGEGPYVFDTSGKRYLDAIASLWYCQVGYGREEIAAAAAEQMRRLHAFHTYGTFGNPPILALAERVSAMAPEPGSKVFFASGGSDAVDSAAKLARRYFQQIGELDRVVLISRERAYHGVHGIGTSIGGIPPNKEGFGPLVEDVVVVPWDSAEALAAAIEEIGAHRVAAFYCEPVIGAGGVLFPPEGYLGAVRRIVAEAGALFIADEVITGFGRCGDWFASSRFALEPDLITFAKGITSGYVPLGGVIASPRISKPFWEPGVMWRHGYTYSGHTTAAAVAMANLDIMEREALPDRAREIEAALPEVLEPLLGHDLVTEVRTGPGALAAVQFDQAAFADDPALGGRLFAAALDAGVITRVVTGNGFQVSPPLIVGREHLEEMAAAFDAALTAVGG